MMEPLLTIALSSYNYGRYVDEALGRLRLQLGPDCRLLIIEDGSTDDSQARLRRHAEEDEYITLVLNKANRGIHAVLNQALGLLKSPWVLFSAMDDLAYPDLAARLMSLAARYPKAGLLTAPADCLTEKGIWRKPWAGPALKGYGWLPPEGVRELMAAHGFWFAGMASALAVKPLLEIGGFDPKLGHLADSFAAQCLALRHGLAFSGTPLAGVRRFSASYSQAAQMDPGRELALRQAALEWMGERPDLFPVQFQKNWGDFSLLWGALRALFKAPPGGRGPWLAALSLGTTGAGQGRASGGWVLFIRLFLGGLFGNPLFRTRLCRQLRAARVRISRKFGVKTYG